MAKGATVKILHDRLELIQAEIATLKAQETLLKELISQASGAPKPTLRPPRHNVKQAVLELLAQVGADGLNASRAVELAANAGVAIERNTVSSLLSRLKNDGVVEYDGRAYRLVKGEPKTQSDDDWGTPNVQPIRSTGVFS